MVKIERSFPAPESLSREALKKSGTYNQEDVFKRLVQDFHGKCYICGLGNLQDPQIEHRLPHKGGKYRDRMFDWENLFLACGHCNGVKAQKKYDEGIIDCCREDPEQYINFRCNSKNVELTSKVSEENREVELTIMLIREVFNLRSPAMRSYKSARRFQGLQMEMNMLLDNLESLRDQPDSKVVLRKLKALLRRESQFAAFKRCYVRDHLSEYPELKKYLV